ncbi:MAG: MFS transporter [Candidatus Micrarchaeaceae archaeon]
MVGESSYGFSSKPVSPRVRSPYGEYEIYIDENGRKYRVGEKPEDITKKLLGIRIGRRTLVIAAWMAFFFGSVLEYGWGVASSTIINHYHWSVAEAFFNYTAYVFAQATITAFIFQRLRERGLLDLRRMLILGGALLMIAYFLLANSFAAWISYLGYASIGGFGAGFGYATGGAIINKWFPDKRGWRLGFANGAWAYGAVPFIVYYIYYFNTSDFKTVLYITGVIIGVGLIITSFFSVDPPKNWWPTTMDPILASKNKIKTAEMRHNPPAVAQFTTKEFLATRQGKVQMASFTLALAASLFNVSLYAPFGAAMGFTGGIAFTVGAAGFALTDGIGRPIQGFISNYLSRRIAVAIFYALMGVGGLGVLYAGFAHQATLWAVLAVLTGAVSGACFVFDWLLIASYFGENYIGSSWSIPYMLKVVGGAFGGIGATIILTLVSGGTFATVLGVGPSITFTYTAWSIVFYLAAAFALIASALVFFFEKQPTYAEYVKVRQKLGEPLPSRIAVESQVAETSGGDKK